MSKINTILGKIKKANEEKQKLASQKYNLGKGKTLLDEAQKYEGDLEFFFNQFEIVEDKVMKARQVLDEAVSGLNQLKEEVGNQGDDADSVRKEALRLGAKMDKIAQEMMENDLDARPVMAEVELLDKAVRIGKQTKEYASNAIAAINNAMSKI